MNIWNLGWQPKKGSHWALLSTNSRQCRHIQQQSIIAPDRLFCSSSGSSNFYNQATERMLKLCSNPVSPRKRKWDLPLQSCSQNCTTRKRLLLKESSSSSPTSHFFPFPFPLTIPIGGRFNPRGWLPPKMANGGEDEKQETLKKTVRNHYLFPDLQMPWPQASRENPSRISVSSLRSIWVQISFSRQV